ncbi:hypothetical protein SAMN04489709_1563 [Paracidovorax citrulli]|nr:hypothetical protein SAMN04489709_1563 [Paracidovorax citrulli]
MYKPPCHWIVVPMPVVVQPRLAIEVLSLESEGLFDEGE